jgi:UDP-N-acetylmuramyl pentapeptide synthase
MLGDMGEVGDDGPAFHEEVGAYARERGIETVWTAGTLAAHTARVCGAAEHADSAAALVERLALLRATGRAPAARALLVKGSRFMKMEQLVAALRAAEKDLPC